MQMPRLHAKCVSAKGRMPYVTKLRTPASATWYGFPFHLRTGLSLPKQDACDYSITVTPQEYEELLPNGSKDGGVSWHNGAAITGPDYGSSERNVNTIPARRVPGGAEESIVSGIVKKARTGSVVCSSFRFA